MIIKVFDNKKANAQKLLRYGFRRQADGFNYAVDILGGQMRLNVVVFDDGKVLAELNDVALGEPYTLHLVDDAVGSFVGVVRKEFFAVLDDIAAKCFDSDVFKSETAVKVMNYVRDAYGDELEFLWDSFPYDAIWRRKDSAKWYGLIVKISRRKLGFDSDEAVEVLIMRGDPQKIAANIAAKRVLPAYHLNKKNWFSVCLDDGANFDDIRLMIDNSYALAKK